MAKAYFIVAIVNIIVAFGQISSDNLITTTFMYSPNPLTTLDNTSCPIHSINLFNNELVTNPAVNSSFTCHDINQIINICADLSIDYVTTLLTQFTNNTDNHDITNLLFLSFECLIIFIQNETNIVNGQQIAFPATYSTHVTRISSLNSVKYSHPTIHESIIINTVITANDFDTIINIPDINPFNFISATSLSTQIIIDGLSFDFHNTASTLVQLNGVALNGQLMVDGCKFVNAGNTIISMSGNNAAITPNGSMPLLMINNSTFSNCVTPATWLISNDIMNVLITIDNTRFVDNSVYLIMYILSADVSIRNSKFINNIGWGQILIYNISSISILNTLFDSNQAAYGAIYASSTQTMNIDNSHFVENVVPFGCIYFEHPLDINGILNVSNVSMINNEGRAIYASGADINLFHCILKENVAGNGAVIYLKTGKIHSFNCQYESSSSSGSASASGSESEWASLHRRAHNNHRQLVSGNCVLPPPPLPTPVGCSGMVQETSSEDITGAGGITVDQSTSFDAPIAPRQGISGHWGGSRYPEYG